MPIWIKLDSKNNKIKEDVGKKSFSLSIRNLNKPLMYKEGKKSPVTISGHRHISLRTKDQKSAI